MFRMRLGYLVVAALLPLAAAHASTFSVLHQFNGEDGFLLLAGVIADGQGNLYGTTEFGGGGNSGTVFSLPIPGPQLAIARSGTSVVLTWSTNDLGYTLESAPALGPPAVWSTASPPPVVVNSVNTVTNPISGTAKFYRLAQ